MAGGCFGLIKRRMPGEKQEAGVHGLRLFVFVEARPERIVLKVTEALGTQGTGPFQPFSIPTWTTRAAKKPERRGEQPTLEA